MSNQRWRWMDTNQSFIIWLSSNIRKQYKSSSAGWWWYLPNTRVTPTNCYEGIGITQIRIYTFQLVFWLIRDNKIKSTCLMGGDNKMMSFSQTCSLIILFNWYYHSIESFHQQDDDDINQTKIFPPAKCWRRNCCNKSTLQENSLAKTK